MAGGCDQSESVAQVVVGVRFRVEAGIEDRLHRFEPRVLAFSSRRLLGEVKLIAHVDVLRVDEDRPATLRTIAGNLGVMVTPVGSSGGRRGTCAYCRFEGKMSKTHVPPKAAFNDGPASEVVRETLPDGSWTTRPGRERDGGIWGWWLCSTCNGKTSAWDSFYADFAHAAHDAYKQAAGSTEAALVDQDFRPGAVLRSVMAGMFAVDATLVEKHPTLAHATFEGVPSEWPNDIQLSVALNASGTLGLWKQPQGRGITQIQISRPSRSRLWTPPRRTSPRIIPGPETFIGAWPFIWFLGRSADSNLHKGMSVGSWIRDDPSDSRPTSAFLAGLAVTGTSSKPGSLMVAYEDLVQRPLPSL